MKSMSKKKEREPAMEIAFCFFPPLKIITSDHLMRIISVGFDFTFHARMN